MTKVRKKTKNCRILQNEMLKNEKHELLTRNISLAMGYSGLVQMTLLVLQLCNEFHILLQILFNKHHHYVHSKLSYR